MDEKKIVKRNLWFFPLGTVGRDMMYCLITTFLYTFILMTKGLTEAQLLAITGIMIGARVFDAINDPIMGSIIEKTKTRWGKFKPWLVIGVLLSSVVVAMVFVLPLKDWSFVILYGIFYFGFSIAYTMHDISYWGMVPALSSDANVRNQYTSRATLFAGVGGTLAGSFLIPMLTTGETAIAGSATIGYAVVAVVICILTPAFLCFTIFGVKELNASQSNGQSEGGLKKTLQLIKNNDQLRWIAIIFLIQQIGAGLTAGGMGQTYVYLTYGYEGVWYTIFSTVGVLATAFLMLFYPAISRKINRKPLMNLMAVIAIVGFAMMIVSRLIPNVTVGFALVTIGYMASNLGLYSYYLIMMISIINTVEYNQYVSGNRDEALVASVRPLITKMASALIAGITTLSYIIFNITKHTNAISDIEEDFYQGLISEQQKAEDIKDVLANVQGAEGWGLLLFMVLIPCAMLLLSNFLYQKKYKLDEAEYERICKELENRK